MVLDELASLVDECSPVLVLDNLGAKGLLVQTFHALVLLAVGPQAVDKAGGSGAQIAFKMVAIGPLLAGYLKDVPQISLGVHIFFLSGQIGLSIFFARHAPLVS